MDILEELRRVIRLEARALTHLEESLSTRFEEAVRMLKACEGIGILKGLFHWTEKYQRNSGGSITPIRECLPQLSGELLAEARPGLPPPCLRSWLMG